MGSWDSGAFDNDDAQDFLVVLEKAAPEQRTARVVRALQVAVTSSYLDVDDGNTAVAAAALVAAAFSGQPTEDDSLRAQLPPVTSQTAALAADALDRILDVTSSEWRQL